MQLQQTVNNVFLQLSESVEKLRPADYSSSCRNLSGATIGQHVRHIIEMFLCLESGYSSGVVNYENRQRDRQIEEDITLALDKMQEIQSGLFKPDKALVLEGVYDSESSHLIQIPTNYYREMIYSLEHTIHHMALIRVGINELTKNELPENYGVSSATVKHKRSCAQ
jgi:hypothetical protein